MRSGPSADAPVIGRIAPDAKGIARAGECREWCHVRYKQMEGWVNRRFLAVEEAGASSKPTASSQNPTEDCNSDDNARKLAGCTALIDGKALTDADLGLAYSRRSDAHLELRNFEQAVADRAKALQLQPSDAANKLRLSGAYQLRAAVRAKTNKPAALADLAEAIRVDPSNHEARIERIAAYYADKNLGKAIEEAKSAIETDGNKPVYSNWLAALFESRASEQMFKSKFAEAISDYSKAIELQPNSPDLLVARGNAFAAKQDDRQATRDYSEAIRLKRDHADAYLRRGELKYRTGHLLESISDLNEAVGLDRKNVTALLTRAMAREANEQYDFAKADYAQVLALEPTHQLAKAGLSRMVRARECGSASKS